MAAAPLGIITHASVHSASVAGYAVTGQLVALSCAIVISASSITAALIVHVQHRILMTSTVVLGELCTARLALYCK